MFGRRRVVKHRGKIDKVWAWHLKQLAAYSNRRPVLKIPTMSFFLKAVAVTPTLVGVGLLLVLSYAGLPKLAPLEIVRRIDPETAQDWEDMRTSECWPDMFEWRLAKALNMETSPAALFKCFRTRGRNT